MRLYRLEKAKKLTDWKSCVTQNFHREKIKRIVYRRNWYVIKEAKQDPANKNKSKIETLEKGLTPLTSFWCFYC